MLHALLADLMLFLHATFILFVVFGGVLVFWRRGWAWRYCLSTPSYPHNPLKYQKQKQSA
jgi:hypothetical protein